MADEFQLDHFQFAANGLAAKNPKFAGDARAPGADDDFSASTLPCERKPYGQAMRNLVNLIMIEEKADTHPISYDEE
jgi:hypothetical protein